MNLEIDIDKIIKDKNPQLTTWLPAVFKNYIKRTIHQDQINFCLRNFSDKQGVDFVHATLEYMKIKYTSLGAENVPKDGRYIFASNHPLGGLDGLILAEDINQHFGDSKLVVNDILMNLTPIKSLFVPVNKHGRQPVEYVKSLAALYNSSSQIIYFPAGLCSRKINGVIQDTQWKKTFIIKAIEYQRDIIPVYVEAENSNFFYNLSNFRKFLGIKANIEMFYLPDEMFKQQGKHINIFIGKPISYKLFTKEKTLDNWASDVREIVYSLKNRINSSI